MKSGLVNINNILEAPKGNNGNNQNNNGYSNNMKKNDSDLWDF